MALTPQRFSGWSPAHQQAVLGSRAGAFKGATGAKQQRILAAAYRNFLANKAAGQAMYDPTAVLSGPSLKAAATSLTNAQINPQLSALDQQSQTVTGQGSALARRSDDYYKQLATQEAQSLAAAQAIAKQANDASSAAAAQAQGVVGQAQQQEQARQAQDQNVRGGGLEGGGQSAVAQALAARLASVAQTGQATSQNTAAQGGNYGGLSAAVGGAAGLKGGEAQSAISGNTQAALSKIAGQRTGVLGARGEAFLKNLMDLRTGEFNKVATEKGLDIKVSSAAQSAADRAAARAVTRHGQNLSAADRKANRDLANKKFGSAQEKDAYERAHHLGPYKPAKTPTTKSALNPKQQLDQVNKIQSLPQLIKTYQGTTTKDATTGKPRPLTQDEIYSGLIQKGYPLWMIHAAQDLRLNGGLSQANVHVLHEHGVHKIPASWLKPSGRLTKTQQQGISGATGGF